MDSAYIYIRFSTPGQEKGDSKERQTKACVGYADRQGWTVAGIIGDYGRSAWKGNHLKSGELGRFADRVRSGEIAPGTILVVEALDRLSRQEWRDARNWLEEMTDLGLRIATYEGGRLYEREMMRSGGIFEAIEILLKTKAANEYSERLSTRLKSSWESRRKDASEGRIISRHVPGWLTVVEKDGVKSFKTIPERVATLRDIYQMAADGIGSRSIARTLNERGIKPWGRAYHHANSKTPGWEHTYVADLLASPAVEGDYVPKVGRHKAAKPTGQRFVGYFGDAFVDADLVARARAGVASRKGKGGRGRDQCRNLFSGLIHCGSCGAVMTLVGNSAKPARYLQCVDAFRGRGCMARKTFPYEAFEKGTLRVLLPLALDDRFFTRPDASNALAIRLAEANKTIEMMKADEARLVEILMKADSDAVVTRLKDAETARRAAEADRDRLDVELTKARGAVTPAEHMKRILEVRHALTHEDHETRLSARRRVAQAIAGVKASAKCFINPDGTKVAVLVIMDGATIVSMDDKGNEIGAADFLDEAQYEDIAYGLTTTVANARSGHEAFEARHADDPAYAAFKRRRAAVLAEV